MSLPAWLGQTCGLIGTVCFVLMLVPQIYLNYRKQSTEGLSLGLVLMWHAASILSSAFYAVQTPVSPLVIGSMACFCFACGVLEGQMAAYRPAMKGLAASRRKGLLVAGVCAAVAVLSALLIGLLYWFFLTLPAAAVYLIGDVCASILLAAGFLPQFYEFLTSWSIEGYSFGVTAFDLVGCTGNVIVLFAQEDVDPLKALEAAAPFLTVIAMHLLVLLIAGVIACSGGRHASPAPTPSSTQA